MNIQFLVLILLVLVVIGALPTWSHSANWGYVPSGSLGLILLILLFVWLLR